MNINYNYYTFLFIRFKTDLSDQSLHALKQLWKLPQIKFAPQTIPFIWKATMVLNCTIVKASTFNVLSLDPMISNLMGDRILQPTGLKGLSFQPFSCIEQHYTYLRTLWRIGTSSMCKGKYFSIYIVEYISSKKIFFSSITQYFSYSRAVETQC